MQVAELRAERHALEVDPRFTAVLSMIRKGTFGWQEFFAPVVANIEGPDHYLVATDFPEYLDIQARFFVSCCLAEIFPAILGLLSRDQAKQGPNGTWFLISERH